MAVVSGIAATGGPALSCHSCPAGMHGVPRPDVLRLARLFFPDLSARDFRTILDNRNEVTLDLILEVLNAAPLEVIWVCGGPPINCTGSPAGGQQCPFQSQKLAAHCHQLGGSQAWYGPTILPYTVNGRGPARLGAGAWPGCSL